MKLLLTSAGITNQSIADTLLDLVGKSAAETKIVVIPTAGNVEPDTKDWYLGQFANLQKHGYQWIDIVDPSASGVEWKERLKVADVVFVSGGNTFHLLDQLRKTGLDKWLTDKLDRIVYVGASAGSIITGPTIGISGVEPADPNLPGLKDLTGLGWVDFEISPHSPDDISYESNQAYAKTASHKLYAIDDATAIKVVDDVVEVISEGRYKEFKQ